MRRTCDYCGHVLSAGTGVSIEPRGEDRWRIRWRERRPDGRWRRCEKWFTGSPHDRDALVLDIRRALDERGTWDAVAGTRRLAPPPPADLMRVGWACIAARRGTGQYSAATADTYGSYLRRVERRIRHHLAQPEGPISVQVLDRRLVNAITAAETADGASESMRLAAIRLLLDIWQWAADDPEAWPGVPTPPRPSAIRDYMPAAPHYGRTVAPTIAQADACLRAIHPRASEATRLLCVILRYTGMRASEARALRGDDWDLRRRTLHIRGTKTRAADRVVPIPPALLDEPGVVDAVRAQPGCMLLTRRGLNKVMHRAWEHSGAPREVWAPANRRYARPLHAFRAAFQAHLATAGVDPDAVSILVGHTLGLRGTHYGRDMEQVMRDAVALLPPVEWGVPPATGRRRRFNGMIRPWPLADEMAADIAARHGPFDREIRRGDEAQLREDWRGERVFVFPRYHGHIPTQWVARAIAAVRDGAARVVVLLPDRRQTKWFRRAVAAGADVEPLPRIAGAHRGKWVTSILLVFRGQSCSG